MKLVVFGGGMQGRVVAADLAARKEAPEVTVADVRPPESALPEGVTFARVDAMDGGQVRDALAGADACVVALPGEIARAAVVHAVEAGARVADVSFTPEPPLDLDARAKQTGAVGVVDVGVAPGLSHVLAAAAHRELHGLDALTILVGGLPRDPPPVFRHAVYFNPRDLVAEYLRPARMRAAGKDVAPAPLDAPVESFEDASLGALEHFVSDGLRTLLASFPDVPDMVERTLRWPGHIDAMRNLREMGLLDEESGAADATARALGARYPGDAHPDALLMIVEGRRGDARRAWRVLDERRDGVSAMSRTTAFTTASVAMMLARGEFTEPGVHAPERLGSDAALVKRLLSDLGERGVGVRDA